MKISSTEKYISLALHSLEHILAPELISHEAKATAEIMKQVLHELLKREHYTPRLLDEHLAEGRVLADRMAALKQELGGAATATESATEYRGGLSHETGFQFLAEEHGRLTERIAHLAAELSALRSGTADTTQQQYISTLLHKAAAWDYAYCSAQREANIPTEAPPPAAAGAPLHKDTLQAFLRTQHPDGERCSVTELKPIPGGFGKQTYRATISDAAGKTQSVIVRKSDPTPMVLHGCFFIDQEFHLLRDVFDNSDLPIAQPLYLGKGVSGVDADFYVMSALPGSVPSSFLGAASAVIPESVLLQMAELMAKLHSLKLDALPTFLARFGHPDLRTDTVESCYRRNIAEWKTYYEKGNHLPSPFVSYLLDWLEQHVPHHANPPVLVHGDFNIHNVLAEKGRITGILDWECAMIGAPEQDLAYVKPIISQHIVWDRFLSHYRASGGPAIDEASMNFYMAFAAMRLCVIFNKGVRNLQYGVTRDIRYAVVDLGLTPEFMKQALACTSSDGGVPLLQ
ncbi:MAG: phosphotransferase family protein [Rhodocyclaceae bacterium]|nr:phosphotransferase family protein [Rhodocyclaceae bacterium]